MTGNTLRCDLCGTTQDMPCQGHLALIYGRRLGWRLPIDRDIHMASPLEGHDLCPSCAARQDGKRMAAPAEIFDLNAERAKRNATPDLSEPAYS